jgi:sarcosine oxidase / L-pipecolate oxidase
VRADYAQAPYADLAAKAQKHWRETEWGADDRYSECGLVLVADKNKEWYVRNSLENVSKLAKEKGEEEKIEVLESTEEIKKIMGEGSGAVGDWGYVNWGSGWADAGESVKWVLGVIERERRVDVRRGEVRKLVREKDAGGVRVTGVEMVDGDVLRVDLVVLATGAWTGQLVDLRGRAEATGQCLAYLELTEEEQRLLEKKPIILNMSTGMFIIPPRNRLLKVARHAYGYRNLKRATSLGEDGEVAEVSIPRTDAPIPVEGERECRKALREIVPSLGDRPFVQTRICWYTDT